MKIKRCSIIIFAIGVFTLSGCASNKELKDLQEKYDSLNADYVSIKADYELMNTKVQELERENADLRRSPDIITSEMTIIGPHGEQDTVKSIRRRYEIIRQLADEREQSVTENSDGSVTLHMSDDDNFDALVNEYWMISGWGPYK